MCRSFFGSKEWWAAFVAIALLGACKAPLNESVEETSDPRRPRLTDQHAGTSVRLQAVSVVDSSVVWASGTEGTYAVTTDGGHSWVAARVPNAAELEFRDVHALSADRAFLLASGPGEMSRVLVTEDRGETWEEAFRNLDPEGFFNCFDFDATGRGWLVGDSRSGRIPILSSAAGYEWTALPSAALPVALEGEAGFSASGTCIEARSIASPSGDLVVEVLLGTGGGGFSRFHRGLMPGSRTSLALDDAAWLGMKWHVEEVPLPAPLPTAGVASVAGRGGMLATGRGMLAVGGGDVAEREQLQETVALRLGEGYWQRMPPPEMPGAVFGLAWSGIGTERVEGEETVALWAVGPGGMAVTRILGSQSPGSEWTVLDGRSYWAVAFAPSSEVGSGDADEDVVGWAVGPNGLVTRLTY